MDGWCSLERGGWSECEVLNCVQFELVSTLCGCESGAGWCELVAN